MNKLVKNFTLRTLATLQAKINSTPTLENKTGHYAPMTVRKSISQTRRDIADLQRARTMAMAANNPKQYLLQDIYAIISDDAHLTSQINNRKEQTISAPFEMVTPDQKVDDAMTAHVRTIPVLTDILGHIWDSEWYGNSVIEQSIQNGTHKVQLVNRRNIVPSKGRFYPDTSMNNYIEYRNNKEFGKWILEFNSDSIGLLNKAVPHILFKKFAQSCWSELCEIYGIPPRVMKTETRDPAMLNRAEMMMREVGAAPWFIIDKAEEFSFASGVNTNGDVYNNLITLCNNEISMLVSGAIIGQDTKHGNESKEKTSVNLLDRLVEADKRMAEVYMNTMVIPSWIRIGWIPSTTSRFRFAAVEDVETLWKYTKELLPHKEVDNSFIEEKFGIKVTEKKLDFQ